MNIKSKMLCYEGSHTTHVHVRTCDTCPCTCAYIPTYSWWSCMTFYRINVEQKHETCSFPNNVHVSEYTQICSITTGRYWSVYCNIWRYLYSCAATVTRFCKSAKWRAGTALNIRLQRRLVRQSQHYTSVLWAWDCQIRQNFEKVHVDSTTV